MSLWQKILKSPLIEYRDFDRCWPVPPTTWEGQYIYNKYLVTCPRHYAESFNPNPTMWKFFYEPSNDWIMWYMVSACVDQGGVELIIFYFDAEDCSLVQREHIQFTLPNFYTMTSSRSATCGSYNKIYGLLGANPFIYELDWYGLCYPGQLYYPEVPPGWYIDTSGWIPNIMYSHVVVNRVDNYVAGSNGNKIYCWRNASPGSEPELIGTLIAPSSISYMAYENRKYLWIVTSNGEILKADYTVPRWEMISTVQDPTDDALGYYITFDTKRKRVVVLRRRPDAVDGAAQHQLEVYYPMVVAATLTQPVPVTSLRTNKQVLFSAHLIGAAGEGMCPYTIYATLEAPATGRMLTPFSNTEVNGRVTFKYEAPDEACTDTIQLSADIQEA